MADEILRRDQNSEPVIGLVTDDASKEIRMGRIDDTSKGLKVMIVGGAGAGTVTDVSVTTANGISGTVATSTSTPAITLALGAITPTSVNGLTITANGTNTLNITTGKTLTVQDNVTITGALGTGAYATIANYLPLAGGTMTGKIVSSGSSEVGKTYTPATGSQTVALDCALNNIHIVTGHANGTAITFTVANVVNSQCFIVSILQGSGTVSTITGWFATVRWAGGSAPTLTATLNKRDTFGFIRTGANTYDGFVIGQNT